MAHFTTCAQLTPSLYPADTTTWFDVSRNPQVVFYAHMLFPLEPGQEFPDFAAGHWPWHPPLAWKGDFQSQAAAMLSSSDRHYAEAQWLDPDGAVIAHFGLTMPARVSADYVKLQARQYIPHTFAMSIGTKDIRAIAGQLALPSRPGQYHIRFYVDGNIEGIAFFRMLQDTGAAAAVESAPGGVDPGLDSLRDLFRALTKTGK
jgi:hypothetical protein